MDSNHPKNVDPRPKRRRDKDNPYEVFTVGIGTPNPRYYLSFHDQGGIRQCMEISKALFDAFDRFELDDLAFMNEVDRHFARPEQAEASLDKRAVSYTNSVEEIVELRVEAEKLHRAIAQLSETQRRRLVLYYFYNLTYEQVAKIERCTVMPVKRSIDAAIKKIKNFFEMRG